MWKTTFSKDFFNKIWLTVEEHEYIYIFEIKFEKIIPFKNGGQNKFAIFRILIHTWSQQPLI